ncbi:O-antigen ligase family protein [Domibacillus indicus]|uniref:O-antigen ligase family protein n=1 Tax=Domibacillus indicus TaxID=1437523 RepID=UPI0006181858|nr:O-antigen ligase family protein [Domibacillus indicus]
MSNIIYSKKSIYRDEAEDELSIKQTDKKIFFLLLVSLIVIPLLVGGHVKEVISPIISEQASLSSGGQGDIFTYFKFIVLLIATALISCLFFYKLFFLNYRLPKRPILWIFLSMFVVIALSTTLAPNKTIALYGQYNRSDGALSYVCYVLLFFIAMHIQYPKKAVRYVIFAFYPLVIVNFILITMNFTGHDAITYSFVKSIVTFALPDGQSLSEGAILLGTLNQWNYMSGMFAVMTVLYIGAFTMETNKIQKAMHFLMALLAVATMLMAISTNGFLTICLMTPLLILLILKYGNKKTGLMTLALFFILTIPILHVLASNNSRVWSESVGFFIPANPYTAEEQVTSQKSNSDFDRLNNVAYANEKAFTLPDLPESAIAAGSGRIYIFGKTLELLKERPVLGYGLDTLMYHFPQTDIGIRGGLGSELVVVDKPHSMYIGILFGTGAAGFLLFIAIVIQSMKLILPGIWHYNKSYGLIAVPGLAWIAFLIQALFNDTLPGTAAPLFILGGIAFMLFDQKDRVQEK